MTDKMFDLYFTYKDVKSSEVLVSNLFTQTHLTVLNTKICISKLSINMFIKNQSKKALFLPNASAF